MNYFFKKIKFHFQSQTSHGLHSPFVFALYNEVLNPILNNVFEKEIMIKALEKYFQCSSEYYHLGSNTSQKTILILDEKNIDSFQNELKYHPDKFIGCIALIAQPHKRIESIWQKLKSSSNVIFSIDIFEMGILTFEKIAPKQDFYLRKLS